MKLGNYDSKDGQEKTYWASSISDLHHTVDLWRINGIDHSIIVQTWKYRKNQELDQYTPQLPKTQLIYLFKSSFFLS